MKISKINLEVLVELLNEYSSKDIHYDLATPEIESFDKYELIESSAIDTIE